VKWKKKKKEGTRKEEVIKSGALARFPLRGEVWPGPSAELPEGQPPSPQSPGPGLAGGQAARRQALGSQRWERPLSLLIQWYYLRPTTAAESLDASCP